MAVILKKEEKAEKVIGMMTNPTDVEEFKKLFKATFPDDYAKIVKTYNAEERDDKKGKGHPMPHPDTYLNNMYKVAMKKRVVADKNEGPCSD